MRENGREQRRERQLKRKKKLIHKYYNVCVYLDKYNSTCKILNNKGFVLWNFAMVNSLIKQFYKSKRVCVHI